MTGRAELFDLDFYCDLLDECHQVEIIQEGELNLHRIVHPRRGFLTAMQGGRFVLLVEGDFRDNRGLPTAADLHTLERASQAAPEPSEGQSAIVLPFPLR